MIFNYLFFSPLPLKKPIVIDQDLNVSNKVKKLFADPMFNSFQSCLLTKNPYFFYCGTHEIEQLEAFAKLKQFNYIKNCETIDFYFFEPLTHYLHDKHYGYMPHILRINNDDHDISKLRSLELDSISKWAENSGLSNVRVFCTEYKSDVYYKDIYKNLSLSHLDVLTLCNGDLVSKHKHQYSSKEVDLDIMTKKFILPTWRYDPVRHFVVSFMTKQDIIKDSHVSFYYSLTNDDFIKKLWFNWYEFKFKFPEFSKLILEGNDIMQNNLPYTFDAVNPKITYDDGVYPNHDGVSNIIESHRPEQYYDEAVISIVMESRFSQPWPNISEKTANAILMLKPFIIAGAPGTLSMLHDMGFKTFNDYWDESYDTIMLNDERLVAICNVIESISKLSMSELKDMYQDMLPILRHNLKNMSKIRKFYKKYTKN